MAKSTNHTRSHAAEERREEERAAHQEHDRMMAQEAAGDDWAAAEEDPAAEPRRHPVLEQIFGRAPIESVPEGQPLPPPRRPLPVAADDVPARPPLTPSRR